MNGKRKRRTGQGESGKNVREVGQRTVNGKRKRRTRGKREMIKER